MVIILDVFPNWPYKTKDVVPGVIYRTYGDNSPPYWLLKYESLPDWMLHSDQIEKLPQFIAESEC
jgi:hypothetical protein